MTPVDPDQFRPGSGDHRQETPCPSCGYDLRGLPVGTVCPECGVGPAEAHDPHVELLDPRFQRSSGASDEAGRSRVSRPYRSASRTCQSCGFDLSGGTSVGRCPDCGLDYDFQRERSAAASTLLPSSIAVTRRWRLGVILCIVAMSGYICLTGYGLFTSSLPIYELGMLVAMAAWCAGCWLILPDSLDGDSAVWRVVRLAACGLQLLWIPAFAGDWLVAASSSTSTLLLFAIDVLNTLAFVGLMLILSLLSRMMFDLYLRDLGRLLGNMIWIAIPIGLLDWWFPYPSPGGQPLFSSQFSFSSVAMCLVILPLVLIPIVILLTCIRLFNHSRSTRHYVQRRIGREERVRAKRGEAVDPEGEMPVCATCGLVLLRSTCPNCDLPSDVPEDIPLA